MPMEENLFTCKITATVIELRFFMKKMKMKKMKNLPVFHTWCDIFAYSYFFTCSPP